MPYVTTRDFIDFLVVTVLLRGIFAHWLSGLLLKLFKYLFIKTEREVALYIHYRNRASGKSKKR
jgi:hypothetical protein